MAHTAQAPAHDAELQPGDHVYWKFGVGQARGQVVEKITENKKLGSRVFKASPNDPKYVVKSDSSGKEAVRKPEALHKIDEEHQGKQNNDAGPGIPTPAKRKQRSSLARNGDHHNAGAEKHDEGDEEEEEDEDEEEEEEEEEDVENEEEPKKAPHIAGHSSARENAAVAKKNGGKDAAKNGGEDAPKKGGKDAPKKGAEDAAKKGGEDLDLADADEEEEDTTYDPQKDLEAAGDAEADEAAFDALPADEKLLEEDPEEGGGEPAKDKGPAKDAKPTANRQSKQPAKPPANRQQSKGGGKPAPARSSQADSKGPKRPAAKKADVKNHDDARAAEEEEDTPYDPQQDAEDAGDVEDDEAAIDALPADDQLLAEQDKDQGGGK